MHRAAAPPPPQARAGDLGRSADANGEAHPMSAARASLDYEQRLQVLGELAAYPPGERLLARLVILEGVTLPRALRARVADVDLTAGRLTIAGERSRSRVVALDVGTVELAARAIGQRPASAPLFVDHQGRTLYSERFRRSVLAAARRAGVPASLTVMRPSALIPA
jgi:integrase